MSPATETEEHKALRSAVAALGKRHGRDYDIDTLWSEAAKLGHLGVNLPEAYGGGGGGVGRTLHRPGRTRRRWLPPPDDGRVAGDLRHGDRPLRHGGPETGVAPGLADGTRTMAFGIAEPDAGSNSHRITTTARRDGADWLLSGRKVFISGVDIADATLIVGRTEDARTGRLKPCLFIVPRDADGFGRRQIDMELHSAEKQFELTLDDVRPPPTRSSATRTRACSSCSRGSTPSG